MGLANYTSFGVFEPENNISIDIGGEEFFSLQTTVMESLRSAAELDIQLAIDLTGMASFELRLPSLF